jgi:hypothetical protein
MKDDDRLSASEDEDLKKLLGEDDDSPSDAEAARARAQQEVLGILNTLVEGFVSTQDEVVKQSNENRAGLQDEIDHLHKLLVNNPGPKPMRECEIETLAKLRQIQTDQTANRVQLMDSAARMISALKYLMKDGAGKRGNKGDSDLRSMLGSGVGEDAA